MPKLEFFYHQFTDLKGNYAADKIEICDAIAISFIKMEYPFLIDNIKNNLQKEGSRFDQKLNEIPEARDLLQIVFNRKQPQNQTQNQKRTSNRELMSMVLKGKFDQPDSQPN